jgi:thiamine biosynthesis protein ThiI
MILKDRVILLRLGELTLKGKNRFRFEQTVREHLRAKLKAFDRLKWVHSHGRLFIELNGEVYEDVAKHIDKTFGIQSYSPVDRCSLSLDHIMETALSVMSNLIYKPATFKVSVRRPNKDFIYDTQEMNRRLGGYLLQNIPDLSVDVHHPEIELRVEIRDDFAYIFCEVIPGLGGYPSGTNGKALLLLSGGIDSPVAGWLALKRGLHIEAVHFHSYPYTSERAQQKVIELAEKLAEYSRRIVLHMVPFTDIQLKLKEIGNDNLLITLIRRAMMRITTELANKQGAGAIVTGENLGQVASQTLPGLTVIGQAAGLPLLQPLIMMDKQEIINQAIRIGSYPISILPFEDCCTLFVPKSPSTNPNIRVLEAIEKRAEWLPEYIQQAVDKTDSRLIITGKKKEIEQFF